MTAKVAVLGAGAWGSALTMHVSRQSAEPVWLWDIATDTVNHLRDQRTVLGLKDATLADHVEVTDDRDACLHQARYIICAVPSHGFVDTMAALKPLWTQDHRLIIATKGMLFSDHHWLSLAEAAVQHLGVSKAHVAVLSGPSFAQEVADARPTALVLACDETSGWVKEFQSLMGGDYFRLYLSDDVIGVSLCGAIKNVLAVASGICDGLGLGDNPRAALITRGLNELTRLGDVLGIKGATINGLSGIGDLLLTATSRQSRNYRFGYALGRGQEIEDAVREVGQIIESRHMAKQLLAYAGDNGLDLPIIGQVCAILDGQSDVYTAMRCLLETPVDTE